MPTEEEEEKYYDGIKIEWEGNKKKKKKKRPQKEQKKCQNFVLCFFNYYYHFEIQKLIHLV